MSVFQQAFFYVLHNEGGLSNHPNDRGGETKYGITTVTARRHGFRSAADVTLSDASDIYYKEYWPTAEPLVYHAPRVAIKVFDIAVVSGPRTAIRILQRALSALGYPADDDGVWGLQTLGALRHALSEKSEDFLLQQIVLELSSYFRQIAQGSPSQRVFLKGWLNRARRLPPLLPPEPQ